MTLTVGLLNTGWEHDHPNVPRPALRDNYYDDRSRD
jgi:hypothetical protein